MYDVHALVGQNRDTFRVSIEPSKSAHMWMRRQYLYAFMQRVALNPSVYLRLPVDRVLGVWTVVKLTEPVSKTPTLRKESAAKN